MKFTGLFLALMMMASIAFAEQPATVYSRVMSGNVTGMMPETDGLDNVDLQKSANSVLRNAAESITKQLGSCNLSYTVTLNRPSVVGILLKAENASGVLYKGINIDLTTGKELDLTDIFREGNGRKEVTGAYYHALLGEDGLMLCDSAGAAYDRVVPYKDLLPFIRAAAANRILPITKLTNAVEGRVVPVKPGALLAIKLDANRSTGYSWVLHTPDEAAVYEIGRSYIMPMNMDNQVGVQGSEIIFLAVQKTGLSKVTMEYKRGWEMMGVQNFSFDIAAY